jgi:pimeloyl-ACP methyl ester carboxylesterase
MSHSRRTIVTSAAAMAAMMTTARSEAPASSAGSAKFVLVHGAWHGAWCWDRVIPLLRGRGHAVQAQSLTGLGERVHLSTPDNSLDLHISDVVNLIEAEELENVILTGHSYGGMVITGVADRIPHRIKRLIYVNAFVPEDGKALIDYLPPHVRDALVKEGAATGMLTPFPASLLGITNQDDVQWVSRRLVKQAYRTQSEPIRLSNPERDKIPCSFVNFSGTATRAFDPFVKRVRNDPKWRVFEINAGIDGMITNPQQVADVLIQNI